MLLSQLTGAPSRNNVPSSGLQNPKPSKASGDTNSGQDICILAIYEKVVTLDLNLSSVNANKRTYKQTLFPTCIMSLIFWNTATKFVDPPARTRLMSKVRALRNSA